MVELPQNLSDIQLDNIQKIYVPQYYLLFGHELIRVNKVIRFIMNDILSNYIGYDEKYAHERF